MFIDRKTLENMRLEISNLKVMQDNNSNKIEALYQALGYEMRWAPSVKAVKKAKVK